MNDSTIIVLVSVAVGVLAAVWTVLKWNARRSVNFLLRGTGIILIVVGAGLVGLTGQIIDWLRHLTQLTTTISVGIALAVLGLVVYFIGGTVKVPTKDEAKLREYQREAKQRENDAKLAAKAQRQESKAKRGVAAAPMPDPSTASGTSKNAVPDGEVDNILHKHGIE